MLNLCGIVMAILKMATGRNFSISGINSGHHNLTTYQMTLKLDTMLNLCGIVVAILKMATGRNCSMSGINSGHHYLPTYQILMISDNVEFLQYCGGHFEKGRPVEIFQCRESIQDIIIYPHIKF
jgi:putative Mn2+ efflux pump MntP